MKRIGILTWFYGANYGAKAQAYALQETINEMGYEALIINYRADNYKRVNLESNCNSAHYWLHPLRLYNSIKKCNVLDRFNSYYHLSKDVRHLKDINDLELDIIILGSDAIFNVRHPLFDPVYYGVGINKPKISYAASCEYLDPDYRLSDDLRESVKELRAISVRDVNTQMLIKRNTGITPKITLDPTFLHDFAEFSNPILNNPYILIYTFSEWNQISAEVKKYAKTHKFEIISVGCKCTWSDKSFESADEKTWICSFKRAELVITDSFHGVVFSIKNEKQIVLLGREDKSAKLNSLLDDFSINKKYYRIGENLESYLKEQIDYATVRKHLEQRKLDSEQFLRSYI